MKKNPVVHFEMPLTDKARAKKFYSEAFGWDMQDMGEEYGGYVMAMTADSDKNGPLEKGMINGGFYEKNDAGPHPSVVISVEDIEAAVKRVKDAGGEVMGDVQDIPNVGKFASFKDTEGNRVSMLQPVEM